VLARERSGKDASPTVAIIVGQSVNSAEQGDHTPIRRATTLTKQALTDPAGRVGPAWRTGLMAMALISKERHILVGTLGLQPSAAIHSAKVQDRDGVVLVLRAVRRLFADVKVIFSDGA
jgi:hypothetical protein